MVKVVNVHRRSFRATPQQVGALLDALASPADRLWGAGGWPRMKFDSPLAVGARGGHGPIRYTVEACEPGRSVRFRFTAPEGLDGWHGLHVSTEEGRTILEHRVEMALRGRAGLTWPLLWRPLHDALVEDVLAKAQVLLGEPPQRVRWSPYVHLLRRLAAPRRPRPSKEPSDVR